MSLQGEGSEEKTTDPISNTAVSPGVDEEEKTNPSVKADQGQGETTPQETGERMDTTVDGSVKKGVIPKVRQDLSRIRVVPTFMSEDIEDVDLEECEEDGSDISESEEEEDAVEGDSEEVGKEEEEEEGVTEEQEDLENKISKEKGEDNEKVENDTTVDNMTDRGHRETVIQKSHGKNRQKLTKQSKKSSATGEDCELVDMSGVGTNEEDVCNKSDTEVAVKTKKVSFSADTDILSTTQSRKRKQREVRQSTSGKFLVKDMADDEDSDSAKKPRLTSKQVGTRYGLVMGDVAFVAIAIESNFAPSIFQRLPSKEQIWLLLNLSHSYGLNII